MRNHLSVRWRDVTEGLLTPVIVRSTCMFIPQTNPTHAEYEDATKPTLILLHWGSIWRSMARMQLVWWVMIVMTPELTLHHSTLQHHLLHHHQTSFQWLQTLTTRRPPCLTTSSPWPPQHQLLMWHLQSTNLSFTMIPGTPVTLLDHTSPHHHLTSLMVIILVSSLCQHLHLVDCLLTTLPRTSSHFSLL